MIGDRMPITNPINICLPNEPERRNSLRYSCNLTKSHSPAFLLVTLVRSFAARGSGTR